ncbi:hypothetical protein FNF27_05960 [Cafeteria roenbergensis]|uniref:Uncharacterized protein n=1 Tax=Cafeteria roenbergensis TaxID=33653 RepID=A0A5A8CQE0_CAFRO|nr:hypothetical protein FNF29_02175 [Cafeteria roenbergensis]KAA0172607.1 hypothetical protein FNF27_05960 [Cafeteria roenbergensis]|eukprot:KAA0154644.1 hypothetical protein FNF29_02175 [Cafeteria roenbergensis]
MGACCSSGWEHQEALAWYAQAGDATCLSKGQIWTLVAGFRSIREAGKRNMYAMKNAKLHYDPRKLTKEHLAEWLPDQASLRPDSLMFTAVILAGAPSDGRAHLLPSEFCRMVERVCSVDGIDLARLVFDASAHEHIAGKRWLSLRRVLKKHHHDIRKGTKRAAGVAVGDLALILELNEVHRVRSLRGMPATLVTVDERERAEECMTLREFLGACRRTPQILWPAQWVQRQFRRHFFGERWWAALVRRSQRLGLPADDDALEALPGTALADTPAEAAARSSDKEARAGSVAARLALSQAAPDDSPSPLRALRGSSRLLGANRAWARAAGGGGAATPTERPSAASEAGSGRRVRFAADTKPASEDRDASKGPLSSPRGAPTTGSASDLDAALDMSSDGVSALTALVLEAERRRKAGVRRAKGFAAQSKSVYSRVAAPGGVGIDEALGFTPDGKAIASPATELVASSAPDVDEPDAPPQPEKRPSPSTAARSQRRAQARARRQRARAVADTTSSRPDAAGELRSDVSPAEGAAARRRNRSLSRGTARGKVGLAGAPPSPPGPVGADGTPPQPDLGSADARLRAREAMGRAFGSAAAVGSAERAAPRGSARTHLAKKPWSSMASARGAQSSFPGLARPPGSSRGMPRVQSSTSMLAGANGAQALRPAAGSEVVASKAGRLDLANSSGVSLVSLSRAGAAGSARGAPPQPAPGPVAVRVLKSGRQHGRQPARSPSGRALGGAGLG